MKKATVLIISLIVLSFSMAAFAQKKGKAEAGAPTPNGMWDAVDPNYDYTVSVYEFDSKKKTVRIMDGKDEYLLSFTLAGNALTLYYMQNNKATKNVFETWTYSAADKNFKVAGDYPLILRDRNTAPKQDPKKKKNKPKGLDKYKKKFKK